MAVSLYRVIQPVSDIELAERFYSTVLADPGERVSPGRHYFRCGSVVLACYDPVEDGDELEGGWQHHFNQYLYFAVTELEGARGRVIDSGGHIESDIASMPWGERLFYAQDPFGNPICFVDRETVFVGDADAENREH
ncbi:MAG: VOC family protein [Pseudomonadota bacterium]